MRFLSRSVISVATAVIAASTCLAQSRVVMRDGSYVECRSYEIKGNQWIITSRAGKLLSVRADKVDATATAAYAGSPAVKETPEAKTSMPRPRVVSREPVVALTNEDLERYHGQPSPMGDETTVTVEDPSEPADRAAQLENGPPPEPASKETSERVSGLKARYQSLRARQEGIEAQIPEAEEAAENEDRASVVSARVASAMTEATGREHRTGSPARDRLQQLESEIRSVNGQLEAIESEARDLGVGRPGLMQK